MKTSIKSIIKKVTNKKSNEPVPVADVKKASVKKVVVKKATVSKKPSAVAKKEVAKKAAPKKVAAKKTTAVKAAGLKKIVVASDKHSFWLNDGQILNDLIALKNAFSKMEKEVYHYHTKNGRHDFANWVEDVLHDSLLAEDLRKSKTPKTAHLSVEQHLRLYQF